MYIATNKDLVKARREAVSFTRHAAHRRVATMEGGVHPLRCLGGVRPPKRGDVLPDQGVGAALIPRGPGGLAPRPLKLKGLSSLMWCGLRLIGRSAQLNTFVRFFGEIHDQ